MVSTNQHFSYAYWGDVVMILALCVDGPSIIEYVVVGERKKWHNLSDCYDDVLRQHHILFVVYHDPNNIDSTFTF